MDQPIATRRTNNRKHKSSWHFPPYYRCVEFLLVNPRILLSLRRDSIPISFHREHLSDWHAVDYLVARVLNETTHARYLIYRRFQHKGGRHNNLPVSSKLFNMDMDDPSPDHDTQYQPQSTYGAVMTEAAQKERRNSIRDILADDSLTPLEKRRGIQSLMDGRRRSSNATHSSTDSGGMARAAAETAAFYNSDTEDDPMDEGATGAAGGPYQYENGGAAGQSNGQPHRRKGRSTSLPGWSEVGMQTVAPVAAPGTSNSVWDDPINVSRRMEKTRPPCSHYERNCTIVSPCCGLAFGCRICHDECPTLPVPFARRPAQTGDANPPPPPRINWADADTPKRKQSKRPSLPLGFDEEETHHEIDRFAIREIICRLCYVRQSSKT